MRTLLMAVIALGATAVAAAADYPPGFIWNRYDDWVDRPAADQGTANGNPSGDAMGKAVWRYQWIDGGGPLGTSNPWFQQTAFDSVWNSNWYGIGASAWARGVGLSPPIFRDYLLHNLEDSVSGGSKFATAPLLTWTDPVQQAFSMHMLGTVLVGWGGQTGGFPTDADVVIAERHAAAGTTSVLYSQTFVKPHHDLSGEFVPVLVDLNTIVSHGDSILVSIRGHERQSSYWVILSDKNLDYYLHSPLTPGDANADGAVGFGDLLTVAQNYGKSQQTWANGDFDNDGKVGFSDLLLLSQHYGRSAQATVPEASAGLLVFAASLLIVGQRRRGRICVLLLMLPPSIAAADPVPVRDPNPYDLWDVHNGITIVDHSALDQPPGGMDARDVFGGEFTGYPVEHGDIVFLDGLPTGYTDFIQWRTLRPTYISTFSLDYQDESPGVDWRNLAHFTLEAKDPATGEWVPLFSQATPQRAGPVILTKGGVE